MSDFTKLCLIDYMKEKRSY